MANKFPETPRHAPGTWGGKEFQDAPPGALRIGVITRVDELHMKADIRVITGGADAFELDLTQAMSGPRSFWGGVPEVNSVVVLAYRPKHGKGIVREPMIVGYLPVASRGGLNFHPIAPDDPATVSSDEADLYKQLFSPTYRVKRLKLRPGDVGGMSADGSELVLNRSIVMLNRAGDLIELRDSERTLITQSINTLHSSSGVKVQYGPARRGAFYLPYDIFQNNDPTKPLVEAPGGDNPAKPNSISPQIQEHYFGQSVLEGLGPGNTGDPTKYCNKSGVVNAFFNNTAEFPPVTYSNGRKVFFAATIPNANFESQKSPADIFTEHRVELKHTTDAVQDVLDEIDGFNVDTYHPRLYIEHVLGTVVGNDPNTDDGMNLYGRVLKPSLFDNWQSSQPGRFKMLEATRTVGTSDLEVNNQAGAYLFRINPPSGNAEDDPFAICVSKQGKTFVNIPGSTVEDTYDGTKNVSLEASLGGGLKAYIGKEALSGESVHLFCEGSVHVEFGPDARGKGFTPVYHCSVNATYLGGNDNDNNALSENIRGNHRRAITGDTVTTVNGSHHTIVDGQITQQGTRVLINGIYGYSLNAAEYNHMISGKTQMNYALVVLENIAAGGKIQTILAGGYIRNVLAGAQVTNVAGGAMSDNVGAAYSLAAGGAASTTAGGAISQTAGGAYSATAGAAVSITAGLAATVTSGVAVSLVAPQSLLGGPAAVLGIARGTPMMPPGAPSLDWITGLPLMGCAVNRSL
jgi:hypothetical protein